MSSPTYTFTGSTNLGVVQAMTDAHTAITGELASLDDECRTSLANWTYTSKDEYQTRKANWDAAAATMPTSLKTAADTLDGITERLVLANTNVQSMWVK